MEKRGQDWIDTLAVPIGVVVIVRWAARYIWKVMPQQLRISTEIVGAVLLVLWLGMQGYERFLKPGHDDLDLITLRTANLELPPIQEDTQDRRGKERYS